MIENFEKVIEYVHTQINKEISVGSWTAKLLKVWQESPQAHKVLVEISNNDFKFEKELKLFYTNFQSNEDYTKAVELQLNRLDEYTKAIESIKQVLAQDTKLELDNTWKAKLVEVETLNPLETKVVFMFANLDNSFNKEFYLLAETFISLDIYYAELYAILDKLNTPVVVDYTAMVQNINY